RFQHGPERSRVRTRHVDHASCGPDDLADGGLVIEPCRDARHTHFRGEAAKAIAVAPGEHDLMAAFHCNLGDHGAWFSVRTVDDQRARQRLPAIATHNQLYGGRVLLSGTYVPYPGLNASTAILCKPSGSRIAMPSRPGRIKPSARRARSSRTDTSRTVPAAL